MIRNSERTAPVDDELSSTQSSSAPISDAWDDAAEVVTRASASLLGLGNLFARSSSRHRSAVRRRAVVKGSWTVLESKPSEKKDK